MASKIPLPVNTGISSHRSGLAVGTTNNNNNHSHPTSPRSTSPTSPSPTSIGRNQHQIQHHPHYKNHNRDRDIVVNRGHLTRSSLEQPCPPPMSTTTATKSPPKFEAFMMTGDLMINLATKQTTQIPIQSSSSQHDRIPFRRKKTSQSYNSSSIQFGDEQPFRHEQSTIASSSLPSSPEAGQSRDLCQKRQQAGLNNNPINSSKEPFSDSSSSTNVRLSKSESQLKSSNGSLVVVRRDDNNDDNNDNNNTSVVRIAGTSRTDKDHFTTEDESSNSVAQTIDKSHESNHTSTHVVDRTSSSTSSHCEIACHDERLSMSACSTLSDIRPSSSIDTIAHNIHYFPLSSVMKVDDEIEMSSSSRFNRTSTFNKKDVEKLHAMKELDAETTNHHSSKPSEISTCIRDDDDTRITTSHANDYLPSSSVSSTSKVPYESAVTATHVKTSTTNMTSSSSPSKKGATEPNPAKSNISSPSSSNTMRYPSFFAGVDSTDADRSRDDSDDSPSPELTSENLSSSDRFAPSRSVDVASATRLAKRLFELQGFKKSDVCRHLCKNNEFSQVVAEEYVRLFDFTNERLDTALRKFLSKFSLVGETSERERVLSHFSRRYFECNPGSFSSSNAIHTLTCALMLLNTDLHTDTVGRKMTCVAFVSSVKEAIANLEETEHDDEKNFDVELLKTLYTSIKNEPLQWAVDDEDTTALTKGHNLISLLSIGNERTDTRVSDSVNPFLHSLPSGSATEFKKGYLIRKTCYDPSGKKTPIGKRGWKTFYATLRDLVLYLHKDEHGYQNDSLYDSLKNSVRVHHALASKAVDYSKKDFVFRLQTADQAEYLFKATDTNEMESWIDVINFAAASLSAPPLASAVGSDVKFHETRPLLPVSHTKFSLRDQFLDHETRIARLETDLELHLSLPPERSASKRVLSEYTQKQLYLQYEIKRYRTYSKILRQRLEQTLGPQMLEKVLQRSLVTSLSSSSSGSSSSTSQAKPLTSFSIGEESDDSDDVVDAINVQEPVIHESIHKRRLHRKDRGS